MIFLINLGPPQHRPLSHGMIHSAGNAKRGTSFHPSISNPILDIINPGCSLYEGRSDPWKEIGESKHQVYLQEIVLSIVLNRSKESQVIFRIPQVDLLWMAIVVTIPETESQDKIELFPEPVNA